MSSLYVHVVVPVSNTIRLESIRTAVTLSCMLFDYDVIKYFFCSSPQSGSSPPPSCTVQTLKSLSLLSVP
ncbi:hypothetical protein AHF37_05135 [Paragonimus kellicotti]|nr:hypothetical protein AHF37_05135 [Paragonimus kellicotti]